MGEASVKEETGKKVKKSATKPASSGQNPANQLNKQQNMHGLKPAKPKLQEIRSATILKEERRRTLAPFELFGTLHVGPDCAGFLRKESAWGEYSQSEADKKHEEKATEYDKESSTEKVEKEKIAATKLSTSRTRKLQASNLVDLTQKKEKGDVRRRGRSGKSDNLWSSYHSVY